MRALIVEDEAIWRSILSSATAKLGFEPRTVDNVSDALTLIEQGEFDLLLLDLHMGGPAGLRLLQVVEAREDLVRRTVVVTAYGVVGRSLATSVPVVSKTELGELIPAIRRIVDVPASHAGEP